MTNLDIDHVEEADTLESRGCNFRQVRVSGLSGVYNWIRTYDGKHGRTAELAGNGKNLHVTLDRLETI